MTNVRAQLSKFCVCVFIIIIIIINFIIIIIIHFKPISDDHIFYQWDCAMSIKQNWDVNSFSKHQRISLRISKKI